MKVIGNENFGLALELIGGASVRAKDGIAVSDS